MYGTSKTKRREAPTTTLPPYRTLGEALDAARRELGPTGALCAEIQYNLGAELEYEITYSKVAKNRTQAAFVAVVVMRVRKNGKAKAESRDSVAPRDRGFDNDGGKSSGVPAGGGPHGHVGVPYRARQIDWLCALDDV